MRIPEHPGRYDTAYIKKKINSTELQKNHWNEFNIRQK